MDDETAVNEAAEDPQEVPHSSCWDHEDDDSGIVGRTYVAHLGYD